MYQLEKEGLFVPYVSPYTNSFPPDSLDVLNQSTPIIQLAQVFAYNTQLVPAAQVPTTMDQLTSAQWSGQVIMHDPTTGTTSTQIWGSLEGKLGESTVLNFLTNLHTNVNPALTHSTGSVTDGVATAQYEIGIVCQFHDVISAILNGAPIKVLPIQGMPIFVTTTTAGVVTAAAHPNAARLLINYMASPTGQVIFGNIDVRFPVSPTADAKWNLPKAIATYDPGAQVFYYPTQPVLENVTIFTDQFTSIFSS
jgi:iron(III) transport system substrate-binding protein